MRLLKCCMPCKKKSAHIKHICFFVDTQTNAEKPKELNFILTLEKDIFELNKRK